MFYGLTRCNAIIWVVDKELLNEICSFRAHMGYELGDTCAFGHIREIKFHVGGVLLELFEKVFGRGPHDVMYLYHLIQFVIARKEGEEGEYFKKHAAHSPQIHFVPIVPIGQEAFGGSVPPRRDVLSVRLLGVDPAA